jgi:hypothetical protein
METVMDERDELPGPVDASHDDALASLAAALEDADELALDERLALLRTAEEAIARSLEGLDGL